MGSKALILPQKCSTLSLETVGAHWGLNFFPVQNEHYEMSEATRGSKGLTGHWNCKEFTGIKKGTPGLTKNIGVHWNSNFFHSKNKPSKIFGHQKGLPGPNKKK